MTPQEIQKRLLLQSAKGQVGHFYLVNGQGEDTERQQAWTEQFIRQYWSEIEKRPLRAKNLLDEADLLWMKAPREDKKDSTKISDYTVGHLEELSTFLGYRAIHGVRRFVVIEDIHHLPDLLGHKLLKTLEEPEGQVTFFMLNPLGQKQLSTLESRSIQLQLAWPKAPPSLNVILELKEKIAAGMGLAAFLDLAKTSSWSAEELLQEFLVLEQREDGDVAIKQGLLELARSWNEAETFHQSVNVRLQWIYTLLHKRFKT